MLMENFKIMNNNYNNAILLTSRSLVNKFDFKETEEVYQQIKNNQNNKFHTIIETSTYKYDKEYKFKAFFKEKNYIPIEDLLNIYYCDLDNKIIAELEKAKILFENNLR